MKNLKKHLWLVPVFLLGSQQLWARGFHYGAMVGVNLANLEWQPEHYVQPEPRLGLLAGVFGSIELDPRVQLRGELGYSQKGGRATYTTIFTDSTSGLDVRNDYETSAEMSYIEFPLLLSYIIRRDENQLGSLNLGPYGAWLWKAEAGTSLLSSFAGQVWQTEYRLDRDHFRNFDFGLMAGVSLYFFNFDLNFRYSIGLRRTLDSDRGEVTRFLDPINRALTLSLGYQIR